MPRPYRRSFGRQLRKPLILALLLCSMLVSSSVQARQQSPQPASADSPARTAQPLAPPDNGHPPTPPRLGLPPRDFVPPGAAAGAYVPPPAHARAAVAEPQGLRLSRPPVILPYSTCPPGPLAASAAGRAQGSGHSVATHRARGGAAYPCIPPFTIGPGTVVTAATLAAAVPAAAARGDSPNCVKRAACGKRLAVAAAARSAARAATLVNPVIRQVNVVTCCAANNGATSARSTSGDRASATTLFS